MPHRSIQSLWLLLSLCPISPCVPRGLVPIPRFLSEAHRIQRGNSGCNPKSPTQHLVYITSWFPGVAGKYVGNDTLRRSVLSLLSSMDDMCGHVIVQPSVFSTVTPHFCELELDSSNSCLSDKVYLAKLIASDDIGVESKLRATQSNRSILSETHWHEACQHNTDIW